MSIYQNCILTIIHRKNKSIYIRIRTETWSRLSPFQFSTVMEGSLSQCNKTIEEIHM